MTTDPLNPFVSSPTIRQDKIDLAVKKRHEYDAEQKRVLAENDPNGSEIMGLVAGAWLDAEAVLTIEEYAIYQDTYRKGVLS